MHEDLAHPSAAAPAPAGRAEPALVRLRNISKNFGGVEAVKPLDLDIHRGDFFAILGPSGCGKTTLLRMIGGFIAPTTGSVEIAGVEMTKLGPEMRPTNMVFQGLGLFPHMTVRQNIAYGLRIAKQRRDEIAVDRKLAEKIGRVPADSGRSVYDDPDPPVELSNAITLNRGKAQKTKAARRQVKDFRRAFSACLQGRKYTVRY